MGDVISPLSKMRFFWCNVGVGMADSSAWV